MARILIADDSLVVRDYMKIILERAGHQIIAEATNGLDAYQMYTAHLPDVVTMDINMPGMNGIETVKKIIDTFPDANIIMVSTNGLKPLVFEAINAGARDYILKPIDEERLLASITNSL
ncbi:MULTISPECIES: response regulator [Brevibacillus]|uniref:response regulator n=1 Tax=Brevibacillus TaxID=55080 RepID=UPI000D102F80|nr:MULTISPECIES: response regulator [Brevibacillus]PSJ68657.1 two-component system response regulator [Brevibacillus brevis]RED34039.1 two-component system chemotaxis response regulator CheY [Brevibacillus brevis]TQK62762.1 two-component system chemotaxis response regulator CheY [Brevibacillus sp. AG162]VEF92391.1 Chemotaxis protein CheY [Brevibacillus brevis]GEC92982.1 response regulator [Brevibacillus brevis]